MNRVVEPELLDELPPQDPGAVGSRRDLRRLNWLMGHAQILGRSLAAAARSRALTRIVELGAGDGSLMLNVARRFASQWPRVKVILVDKHDVVNQQTHDEFVALDWRMNTAAADVFEWMRRSEEPVDAIITNLFLHHFSEDRLTELLRLAAARTTYFAATEPRRAQFPLTMSRLAGCIGCNAVTRHDIVRSVRSGFSGRELSALWPAETSWRLQEKKAGLFTHVFVAEKRR